VVSPTNFNALLIPSSLHGLLASTSFANLNKYFTMANDCTAIGPGCPADGSALGYAPTLIWAYIFLAIFAVSLAAHAFLGWKNKTWSFMITFCLGSLMEVIGYVGRILMHNNPYDLTSFVIPSSFTPLC
jgi:hypothetical protein